MNTLDIPLKVCGCDNKTKTRMFPFINQTWNPLGGEYKHNCHYCWAKQLIKRYNHKKYTGAPRLYPKIMQKATTFKETDFVFVSDMCDLFGTWVPSELIQQVLNAIATSKATFLLLTKNPSRYLEFNLPENCVAGATIETNIEIDRANAPKRSERLYAMQNLKHPRKMISVEPIMYFTAEFIRQTLSVKPEIVVVGYDNYHNHLTEPKLEITQILIYALKGYGAKVYEKTLREPN